MAKGPQTTTKGGNQMEIILFIMIVMLCGMVCFGAGIFAAFYLIWWIHKKLLGLVGVNVTQAVFWACSYWHQLFDLNDDTGYDVQWADNGVKWVATWANQRMEKGGTSTYATKKVAWDMRLRGAINPEPPPASPAPPS